jgi:hypothetical protein
MLRCRSRTGHCSGRPGSPAGSGNPTTSIRVGPALLNEVPVMNESPLAQSRATAALALAVLLAAVVSSGCSPAPDEPPGPGAAVAQPASGSAVVAPSPSAGPAAQADCCSCAVAAVVPLAGSDILPCTFDHPAGWKAVSGDDGMMVGAIAGPATCDTICPKGTPAMTLSIGTTPDSNADTMEAIWLQAMPVVGTARCGDSTVTFYSPPGADPMGLLGGVKFYVGFGGKKYGGAATFTCGTPGGWLELRKLFIDTFRENPGTTFGK